MTLRIARNKFDAIMRADPDMPLRIYRNIISLLSSRFTNESMHSCDIEALRARNKLLEVRQRISLDLIADRGMSREEAAKNIAERLRGTMATRSFEQPSRELCETSTSSKRPTAKRH